MMGHSGAVALSQCEPVLAANLTTRVLCELTDKSVAREELEPLQSRFGSFSDLDAPTREVRFAPINGHRQLGAALR